ncbi:exodeoxyribonuclease VII large subunit [Inquilinus ginsengisoli]|uniref:Exodeoxyribonuclease 7 large subunit n=1 Tax=Inquilinus ginsengisoli TaxID=363840 RepID=A0ABU1JSC9_9PROT|nr:exodeoxyribonuclease VII large subunit [Inquilinus ginsengisoli]MDR6290490.1 exodeoxyribonuclease VII large subunit [Inquilinus ginsengisoli]
MTEQNDTPPPPAGRPGSNLPEFTIAELTGALKRTIEGEFGLVRVRAEIGKVTVPRSGHVYLTLKDDSVTLESVIWKGQVPRLMVRPEQGMEVICTGRLTIYGSRSQYQMVIEQMELAGEGAILKMLEERRRRLAAEGLFEAARKRALPFLPAVIGVVTSPTGAVIRDILHRLADRFPRHVLVWPVAVQGETAAGQVAAAIEGFNAIAPGGPVPRPDLLIVARGGGSLEDLMPFNEEIVVRAAAASAIPLISAVGHETDTTLIDFASDRRAPTPTAAAEMAVPVRAELLGRVLDCSRRLEAGTARLFTEHRTRLDALRRGLGDPARLIETAMQRLDDRGERLDRAAAGSVERQRARLAELGARLPHPRRQVAETARHLAQLGDRLAALGPRLAHRPAERFQALSGRFGPEPVLRALADRTTRLAAAGRLLESYSYVDVLRRGYALVLDPATGHAIGSAHEATPGRAVAIRFQDGEAPAVIGGGKPHKPARPAEPKPEQGSLL